VQSWEEKKKGIQAKNQEFKTRRKETMNFSKKSSSEENNITFKRYIPTFNEGV
jgi:hypothetical protein